MKVVILAGGVGSRISEESHLKPKPMIEIGGKPILWHIMKGYSQHGLNDFIICCGYKGYAIKDYFINYFHYQSDVTVNLAENSITVHRKPTEPWKVTLVDTGESTLTGGRLKRVGQYLDDGDFCFTYGDGVSDVPIKNVIDLHKKEGRLATLTAVAPPGRFGAIEADGAKVLRFEEKPRGDGTLINGGFFVLNKKALSFIDGDDTSWEREPMERIAAKGQMSVYNHHGFWQCMDTLRDKTYLEGLWNSNQAPWKTWKD